MAKNTCFFYTNDRSYPLKPKQSFKADCRQATSQSSYPFIGTRTRFIFLGRRAASLTAICSGFFEGKNWGPCLGRAFGKSLPILHKKASFIVVVCRILEQTCFVIKRSQHIWFGIFLSLEIELQRSRWFPLFFISYIYSWKLKHPFTN